MKKMRRSKLIRKRKRLPRIVPKVRKMMLHRRLLLRKQLEVKRNRMKKIRR